MEMTDKIYYCDKCGYETTQTTNHYGKTWSFADYNTCPKCPPWAKYKMFNGHTVWTCKEREPRPKNRSHKA